MVPTEFLDLLPLVRDRLGGRLDAPRAAEALHRAALAAAAPPIDPALCRLLERHLRFFGADPELAATVREIRRWLALSLEALWRADPSNLELLVEIGRLDLALGATGRGRHRLGRVARSGYRVAAEARRILEAEASQADAAV